MAGQALESRTLGPLPLLLQISRAIRLAETIDEMVPWDRTRCRLSPGQRIEALVLNVLCGRTPLYRVTEFYEDTACGLLFGEEVMAEHFSDDCLARALDKLAESQPRAVYSTVAMRACLIEGIDRQFGHFDTTSISLYGEYPGLSPDDLQLVRGYSKDHHPELKQLVLSLLCNRQGIPIWAEPRDGNSQDNEANREAIDDFCAAFSQEELREMAWVADSKLVTGPNLARIDELGLRFVSRLPETFNAARVAKAAALDAGEWDELGHLTRTERADAAHYRACEQSGEIEGRRYRLVVVHSDHLEKRKRQTFARYVAEQRKVLEKGLVALTAQSFTCREDAETAAGMFLQRADQGLFRVAVDVEQVQRALPYGRRGRPSKDQPVRKVREFVIAGKIDDPDPKRLEREQQLRSLFVLITNLDQQAFSAKSLLEEYRDQGLVEQRFAFMKNPAFVDGFYLHTAKRIEALAYVIVMACLVFSVFERRVRAALATAKRKILLPGKRWSERPTGKMLLDLVAGVAVARIGSGPWMISSPPRMAARAEEVVRLAGFDFHVLYSGAAPP